MGRIIIKCLHSLSFNYFASCFLILFDFGFRSQKRQQLGAAPKQYSNEPSPLSCFRIANRYRALQLLKLKKIYLRQINLNSLHSKVIVLMAFRVYMLNGHLPIFSRQDNPAAFEPRILHRALTYTYLAACNLWFLIHPCSLSYDWQMHAILPIRSVLDPRNLVSILLITGLSYLVWFLCRLMWQAQVSANCHSLQTKRTRQTLQLSVRRTAFAVFGTVLPFLPASNLLVTVGFVLAERTLYMSR